MLLRNALGITCVAVLQACGPSAADTITVDAATKYQTMSGWEVHARAWEIDKLKNAYDPTWRIHATAIANRMVNELGINRIQVGMPSGAQNPVDYWTQYVNGRISYTTMKARWYEKIKGPIQFSEFDFRVETSVLPMAAALAARGEKLYVNLSFGDFTTAGYIPGTLDYRTSPSEYAAFVLAFFDRLKTKYGITADALELCNEPEHSGWNGTQLGQALVAVKAKLEAAGYTGINYIGPSTAGSGLMTTYANAMLAVPGAAAALTTVSYHRYDNPRASNIAALDTYAKGKDLKLNMSEWFNATADTLIEDLTAGNVSSWQKWATADRKEVGRTNPQAFYYLADLANPARPVYSMAPNTTFMAAYFRQVRLGAVRVAARSSVTARVPVAFVNTNGDYVVVVKTKAGTGSKPVTIRGLRPGTYGVRTISYNEQVTDLADVVMAADSSLTVTLVNGFTTIYGKASKSQVNAGPRLD